mgnify:CR=1 FL=1
MMPVAEDYICVTKYYTCVHVAANIHTLAEDVICFSKVYVIVDFIVDVYRLKMEEEKKELEERLSSPAALYTNEGTYLSFVCDLCIILITVCTLCR